MDKRLEDFIKNSTSSNRYRAWEKIEHETHMRIKAFFIENAFYYRYMIMALHDNDNTKV